MTAGAGSAAALMAEADEAWRRAYVAVDAACATLAAAPGRDTSTVAFAARPRSRAWKALRKTTWAVGTVKVAAI